MEMVPRPVVAMATRANVEAGPKALAETVRIATEADIGVPVVDCEDTMTRPVGAGQARRWPEREKILRAERIKFAE
jgi:2-C-methyl-D-erythritol 4-phosphate cytidylyltransferase